MVKREDHVKLSRVEFSKSRILLQFFWLLPIALLILLPLVAYSLLPFGKVYSVKDPSRVPQAFDQAVPESVVFLDSLWGTVTLNEPKQVLAWYNVLHNFQHGVDDVNSSSNLQQISHIRNRELIGAINFLDTPNFDFTIKDKVMINGVEYRESSDLSELLLLLQEVDQHLYTRENLAGLLDRYTRVVLRDSEKSYNLSTKTKKALQEDILDSKILSEEDLSELLRSRGFADYRIEIYVNDENRLNASVPQVYISVYKNGLIMVHDTDNTIGSVMNLFIDLKNIEQVIR